MVTKAPHRTEHVEELDIDYSTQVMTLSEFLEQMDLGCYNEYDGSGYLGTKTEESNIPIWSVIYSLDQYPEYTHVYWYNK